MGIDQSWDSDLCPLWWCPSVSDRNSSFSVRSGISSGLGVNISKVRSLHMDTWGLETLLVMSELGNIVLNNIYEAHLPSDVTKPTADTDP